jgi:hypothetical protein
MLMSQRQGLPKGRTRAAAVAVALATSLISVPAPAAELATELPAFGMLGLSRGHVVVLNLVLTGPASADHPGCHLTASFVDAEGQVLQDAAGQPVQRDFVLRPQVAATLQLQAADVLGDLERRKPTRAVLATPPDPNLNSDCRCLAALRETVGPRGKTVLSDYGARPHGGGNPPPPFLCTVLGAQR